VIESLSTLQKPVSPLIWPDDLPLALDSLAETGTDIGYEMTVADLYVTAACHRLFPKTAPERDMSRGLELRVPLSPSLSKGSLLDELPLEMEEPETSSPTIEDLAEDLALPSLLDLAWDEN